MAAHEVSVGTLNAALVHPREVLGPALRLLGVNSIVVAHNHPSGDPTPSREDREITTRLADAARVIGLTLHDHVIIGNGTDRTYSFAEDGAL